MRFSLKIFFVSIISLFLIVLTVSSVFGSQLKTEVKYTVEPDYIVFYENNKGKIVNNDNIFLVFSNVGHQTIFFTLVQSNLDISTTQFELSPNTSGKVQVALQKKENNTLFIHTQGEQDGLKNVFKVPITTEHIDTSITVENFFETEIIGFTIPIPQHSVFAGVEPITYEDKRINITIVQIFAFLVVLLIVYLILPKRK